MDAALVHDELAVFRRESEAAVIEDAVLDMDILRHAHSIFQLDALHGCERAKSADLAMIADEKARLSRAVRFGEAQKSRLMDMRLLADDDSFAARILVLRGSVPLCTSPVQALRLVQAAARSVGVRASVDMAHNFPS